MPAAQSAHLPPQIGLHIRLTRLEWRAGVAMFVQLSSPDIVLIMTASARQYPTDAFGSSTPSFPRTREPSAYGATLRDCDSSTGFLRSQE